MFLARPSCATAFPFLLLLMNAHPTIHQLNETVLSSSPSPSSSAASPSPSFASAPFLRFLHFSVWAPLNWWLRTSNSSRILTIIESFEADDEKELGEEGRRGNDGAQLDSKKRGEKQQNQMVLWMFTNSPEQRIPFVTLINVGKKIEIQRISECTRETEERGEDEKRMEMEVEVSVYQMFVRAKNAVRYQIPSSMDSAEWRVYFVGNDQRSGQMCQLKSLMESKGTSKFTVPPTPPSAPTERPSPSPISRHSFAQPSQKILPAIVRIDHKWPYSRKRPKTPRRSTLSAQRFLTPAHYASSTNSARRPFLQRKPHLSSPPAYLGEKGSNKTQKAMNSPTTTTTYIDILRDRQLYEEVKRSKTNELNSRWSTTFFVFLLLVAFLITSSAAFALLLSLLLQCRPKAVKHFQPNIATIVRR